MDITRIIVAGDIFRPSEDLKRSTQEINIRWLKGLLQPQLEMASGLPLGLLTAEDVAGSLPGIYDLAGLEVGVDSWARLYQALPQALADRLVPLLEGALVVGFEMPDSLLALLEKHGIPYVDLVLHPVRYMQDLLLGFKSNLPAIEARLLAHAMPEARARTATGPMRAFAARFPLPDIDPDTLLFIGQMSQDRSMIAEGRFLRPEDYMGQLIDRIRDLAGSRRVAVKLHPLERNMAVLAALEEAGFEVVETALPVYTLLSSGLVSSVVSVSSSVGEEARFFGLAADYGLGLSTPVRYRDSAPDTPGHISVYDAYLATDFWRDILAPALAVTDPDGLAPEGAPNLLRTTLRTYWGYEDFAFDANIRLGRRWANTENLEKMLPFLRRVEAATRRAKHRLTGKGRRR